MGNLDPKLSDAIADEIRQLHQAGQGGYGTLAKRFGVRDNVIRNIILGRIYNEDGRVPRKPFTPEREARYQAQRQNLA